MEWKGILSPKMKQKLATNITKIKTPSLCIHGYSFGKILLEVNLKDHTCSYLDPED